MYVKKKKKSYSSQASWMQQVSSWSMSKVLDVGGAWPSNPDVGVVGRQTPPSRRSQPLVLSSTVSAMKLRHVLARAGRTYLRTVQLDNTLG